MLPVHVLARIQLKGQRHQSRHREYQACRKRFRPSGPSPLPVETVRTCVRVAIPSTPHTSLLLSVHVDASPGVTQERAQCGNRCFSFVLALHRPCGADPNFFREKRFSPPLPLSASRSNLCTHDVVASTVLRDARKHPRLSDFAEIITHVPTV